MWNTVPEPVILYIFQHLPLEDVVTCSLVCKAWHSATCQNILWKRLLIRDFKLASDTPIKDGRSGWKSEYVRLIDQVPCKLVQTLTKHTDEVLHVAFSHDGKEFVSCSKVVFPVFNTDIFRYFPILMFRFFPVSVSIFFSIDVLPNSPGIAHLFHKH
jgi:WD40 repeat protein